MRRIAGCAALLAACCAAACGLLAPRLLHPAGPLPAPGGAVLWAADHETGDLAQWEADGGGGVFNSGGGAAAASREVARSGHYAARLGLERVDGAVEAARVFRWKETTEQPAAFYSAWYYFPRRYYPREWWNIFQFKSSAGGGAPSLPVWTLNVGNRDDGAMYLYLWDALGRRSYGQTRADLPEGRWVRIEAYYLRSDGDDGRIAVWQDGALLWDLPGVQTTLGPDNYWSVNNYTDAITPPDPAIYVDDAAIRAPAPRP